MTRQTCYLPHPSLYFSDGNVALVAPKTFNECTVFRVHQSLLSKLSPVFGNMFSGATPDERHDGTPMVIMDDAAEQVESLLRFVYHDM